MPITLWWKSRAGKIGGGIGSDNSWNPRRAQVVRDLEGSSGPTFHGKESLDESLSRHPITS